ncbi:hypothetical protein PoB_006173500 [Plakobranchus ocellatus]|uniref:Uncharacterized protein n=1 Tax=Plakobranchus ocellatus TaxID=259542 RepID=A0AAV4CTP9_9GAST|nr:hypothetical protein PoB_006173500 [Plakobranchus ocellatus]
MYCWTRELLPPVWAFANAHSPTRELLFSLMHGRCSRGHGTKTRKVQTISTVHPRPDIPTAQHLPPPLPPHTPLSPPSPDQRAVTGDHAKNKVATAIRIFKIRPEPSSHSPNVIPPSSV